LCKTKKIRNNLINFLSKNKIETRTLFIPMHKLDIYKSKVKLVNTEYIFDKGISLPSYPNLTFNDVDKICRVIKFFFKKINK
jgi:dTDP-4-amino-4,6-dideoxygalactose transaminase